MEVNEGEIEVICLFIVNGVMDQWNEEEKKLLKLSLVKWGQCVSSVLEKGDIGELKLDQIGVLIFNFHAFWYAAKFLRPHFVDCLFPKASTFAWLRLGQICTL